MTRTDKTNPPRQTEIAIVGAGLAGLSAARVLHGAGREVVVVDAADEVGGRVRTDLVDGYRLERGFQVLLTAYPELHAQFDLAALDLRPFDPGALVWDGRRLSVLGDPIRRPRTLPAAALAPVGSLMDKARLLVQRVRLQRTPAPALLRQADGTTESALRSQGFTDRMIEGFFRPFVGGIQLDPSLQTSRRVFDVILQSLLTGDVAVPATGMGALPAQLAGTLPEAVVHLNAAVDNVSPGEVSVDGHHIRADRVIVATDGPNASRLLGLKPVESNAATCVWFSAETAPFTEPYIVLDGTGDGPARNVAVMTNVAPEYAPAGRALIGAACPGVDDPDAEPAVRHQLTEIWGAQVETWTHLRTDAIPHGQPRQYPPFSPKKAVDLGDGLFVCGDHRDTASIQGALFSGRRCAEAVLASMGTAPPPEA